MVESLLSINFIVFAGANLSTKIHFLINLKTSHNHTLQSLVGMCSEK